MERVSEAVRLFGDGFNNMLYDAVLRHPTPRTDAWACVGEDPELFHPTSLDELAQAQEVCAGCPMRAVCLDLGLSRREYGVWGGVLLENGRRLEAPRVAGRKPYRRSQEAIARVGRVA